MTDERVIEILQEIKDKIDTPNRGTCDYFIVDQIESIVKRELSELKGEKEYETKVITRGNCMMCGKELTEGLFFCKECEEKANSRK